MFTGLYTSQQLYVINEIKNNRNVLLSTPHATGKSLIFSNSASTRNDVYYSIGNTDYNLDDLRRQHQNENPIESKYTTLFLDNVLVNDINKFKQNLEFLQSHLANIHIIAYFKNPEKLQRYFPKQIPLTVYFAQADQLELSNLTRGEFRPLTDTIESFNKFPIVKITKTEEEQWCYDRYDKIIDNHAPYNHTLEGKFPKQYFHGPSPGLNYVPTLVIRVDNLEDDIDENLLKATEHLVILKRKPAQSTPHPLIQKKLKEQQETKLNLISAHE